MAASSNLLAKIRNRSILRLLGLAAAEADRRNLAIFLVGGCVRDLVLGAALGDVDLVVEGDPLALARDLAASLGARARSMTPFGTCRIHDPGGIRIDLAMSRRETYRSPAALPEVRPAPIEEDLLRRDFTVNSMALRLNGPRRGELLDPSGGRLDLAKGLLRLHHPLSLADDPTRAFRGARFAARFSWKPAASFFKALSAGDSERAFALLSAARLLRELRLIWDERDPAAALGYVSKWGILARVDPALRWSSPLAGAIRRGARLREGEAVRPGSDLLIALLAFGLPQRNRGRLCGRLGLSGAARREILLAAAAPERARRYRPTFAGTVRLAEWPELAILVMRAAADEEIRGTIHLALRRWRMSTPLLGGEDLIAAGIARGPKVGYLLHQLRRRRFEGRLRTRADELRWIAAHS